MSRPSSSSIATVDSFNLSSQSLKLQDSISIDDDVSLASDSLSLHNSFNGPLAFHSIGNDTLDDDDDCTDPSVTLKITPSSDQSKKFKAPLFKNKTIATTNIFDSYDSDLTKVLYRLENDLSKCSLESKRFDTIISPIDSQLADIRLMIDSEKDCSLLESRGTYPNRSSDDRVLKSIFNEFGMRIMQILFNQYLKANTIIGIEAGKNK